MIYIFYIIVYFLIYIFIPFLAPALAANIERIPVPQPTSKTVFPLKNDLLL